MKYWKSVSQVMFTLCAFFALVQIPDITRSNHNAQELGTLFGVLAFGWYLMYIGTRFLLGQGSTEE